MYHLQKIESPIGVVNIVADESHLLAVIPDISWHKYTKKFKNIKNSTNHITKETSTQLNEYFAKHRKTFNLPMFLNGTVFQKSAWNALLNIPYGETISYGEQAKRVGRPKAVRAIGGANGANPIAIIIPCHRVIGKSGKLTGYASGVDIKKYLLDLENQK